MASSPETDHETKRQEGASSERKDNPFIKFRRFADAHVGSILQGLIGLPSTFSKTGQNPRWADFDEDLRRRDEMKVKQKKLRDADEWQNQDATADIPTTALRPRQNEMETETERRHSTSLPNVEIYARSVPLFSPISSALFADLGIVHSTNSGSSNTNSLRSMYLPFDVSESQRPRTTIQEVQFMTYNELSKRPFLQSNYSLLPYLLFSPYSPIRLEQTMEQEKLKKTHPSTSSEIDNFPYRIAFQDLIQTSLGAFQKPYTYYHPFESFSAGGNKLRVPSVTWMGWISNLYGTNLLQQRETQQMSASKSSVLGSLSSPFVKMSQDLVKHSGTSQFSNINDAPETEQDMYDQLADWATNPSAMLGSLATMLQDPERWLDEKMKLLDSEKGQKLTKKFMEENLPQELLEMAAQMNKENPHRVPSNIQELLDFINGDFETSNVERKEELHENLKPMTRVSRETKQLGSSSGTESSLWVPDVPLKETTTNKAAPPSEPVETSEARVVSTCTTTEQATHEDGSTETCVTVWKRYADGRESTTTTNHFSNPACDENGNPVEQSAKVTQSGKEQNAQQEKKGWFWN